ncbi:MAG: PSD1 domain-containing protein [Phycisphaerales bacterium]|nr:PSD1 domain-containing protein [Phycisphaerales bacterium]
MRAFVGALSTVGTLLAQNAAGPGFDTVAPIFAAHCVECHGPDTQRRSLRLDAPTGVARGGRSGPVVQPFDPAASRLLQHVRGENGRRRMPPEGAPLAPEAVATLRAWIEGGARGLDAPAATDLRPWSTRPLWRQAPAPTPSLDGLVAARLVAMGIEPAPPAARGTWLRRVSLDLIGLPPTIAELDAFASDSPHEARERAVDRLLASRHFGERWAAWWLDLARYADTKGYEKDDRRSIWRYRDWVIDAFNRDLPFDQFTIEQLAGDLLPEPSLDQLIATAFHRNTMTNDEGGTDDEEFRVAAVIDRVNTTMQVWMGMTVGCAQCHDHKYDPLSQREYYELFAFFDQTEDDDHPSDRPVIEAPTDDQQAALVSLRAEQARLRATTDAWTPEYAAAFSAWVTAQQAVVARFAAARPELGPWEQSASVPAASFEAAWRGEGAARKRADLGWTPARFADGIAHALKPGDNASVYLRRTVHVQAATTAALALGSDDALRVWVNDALVLQRRVSRAAAPDQDRVSIELGAGDNAIVLEVINGAGPSGFAFELRALALDATTLAELREPVSAAAEPPPGLRAAWSEQAPQTAGARARLDAIAKEIVAINVPTVPILRERPAARARVTKIHRRGSFLDQGATVTPGVPAALHPFPEGAPRNRLGFAQWLVSGDNPLFSRVLVNHVWGQLFGRGLVRTAEDFGSMGDRPTHQELLDWLAGEFQASGYDFKALLCSIVLSETYGRSAVADATARELDPEGALLSRGPRLRLSAEAVRDAALVASGLFDARSYGPSVMPFQPDGVWSIIYSNDQWKLSEGGDRYRRGLYTFWRRTSPYPAMVAFDAPTREFCVVRRIATNTPLQALVTLNDPAFVEAARSLGRRMQRTGSVDAGVVLGFRACTGRIPTADELARLRALFDAELAQGPRDAAGHDRAWTIVGNVLLNLDETLTKG